LNHKKKKIAFVIGALKTGGAERVISTLSNELIEKFEVTIIVFVKSNPFYSLDDRIKIISCFDKIDQPTSIFSSLKLNYNILKKVKKITKEESIDLLIGFITSANVIAVLAAKSNGIPSLISERNDPLKKEIPRFWRLLRRLVYPKANNLIVQTEKVKDIYKAMLKSQEMTVLPNPIAPTLSQLRDSDQNREKIILSVGRFNNDKRQAKIIEAYNSLNLNEWKLLLIGDGPNKEKLNTLIEKYNLDDRVNILSQVKDVETYYNKSSIFVFASKAEGFPNVLLEAMHFGLPSISTDCNFGPSEIINNGDNGFLVGVNDQDELTERLSQLLKDKKLQQQFSERAIESTKKYMSKEVTNQWEILINRYLK
jgi:GalNAc-alpha-(1->4)-GalNAc-alpha-(1->3)-diNAcBac-PP-undecaprenol alpha-1,4-N-acetyl-D-galactosaminyltransferase